MHRQLTFVLLALTALASSQDTPDCFSPGKFHSYSTVFTSREANANQCLRVCKEVERAIAFQFTDSTRECTCISQGGNYYERNEYSCLAFDGGL